jgi:uncharacterized protein (UPF0248 family)
MLDSHNILQKYYYKDPKEWVNISVCYIDRGAPHDKSYVDGDKITLSAYYFIIKSGDEEKYIPYHRILLIKFKDEILFKNNKYKDD